MWFQVRYWQNNLYFISQRFDQGPYFIIQISRIKEKTNQQVCVLKILMNSIDRSFKQSIGLVFVIKYYQLKMSQPFPNSFQVFPYEESEYANRMTLKDQVQRPFELIQDFIVREPSANTSDDCSGQFIFKCSFNEKLWRHRNELAISSDLSSPENSEERIRFLPQPVLSPVSTTAPILKTSVLQTEKKPNQRQEIPSTKTIDNLPKAPSKNKPIKKQAKGMRLSIKKKKSKMPRREKRDNNYVMKRAHTVLKKCCWSVDKRLRSVTRMDPDGSMDYFVRLLCRLEESSCHDMVIEKFHSEAWLEIEKVKSEIKNESNPNVVQHLNNVIAVLLKGKEAADIFRSGQRIKAMELMYGKGQTLKKVYKMQRAIERLNALTDELELENCKMEAIPDIIGII